MEFGDVMRKRRMVRRFREDPIDPAVLERIVAAAHQGPSAGYSQGVSVVVVTDRDTRASIAELAGEPEWAEKGHGPWLSAAPAHLVLCVEPETYRRRYGEPDKDLSTLDIPWWWVDGGAAMQLLLMAAVDQGLGAGFIGAQDLEGLADLLGVPGEVEIVGIVTVGHPLPDQPAGSAKRGKRPTEETTHRERWGR